MRGLTARAPLVALALFVSACAPLLPPSSSSRPAVRAASEQKLGLQKTSFDSLPGWRRDRQAEAIAPLRRSCRRIAKLPDGQHIGKGTAAIGGTASQWRAACAAANRVAGSDATRARRYFEKWFDPYLVTANGRSRGLFTGYFEMQLKGSWVKTAKYKTPIYGLPPEMIKADLGLFRDDLKGQRVVGKVSGGRFVPFDTRAAINAGSLAGRGLEILWVDSPIDSFFLHVQGSGRVVMTDGSVVRIGFAGRNGRAYRSIGAELIRRGKIPRERMSMQAIRDWLKGHPAQASDLMATNPSYIFFRIAARAGKAPAPNLGPVGAAGVALTPGRSLAIDRHYIPLGLPLWLDTTDPLNPTRPLRRVVITQDTGGAIKGPVRGDLFWGFGKTASVRAGLMKQTGRYFLLLPKRR